MLERDEGGGVGGGVKTVDKTVSHFFHGSLIPSPPYAISM